MTLYLSYILTFFLTFYLACIFWHSFWYSIRHSIWYISSHILSALYVTSCTRNWGPAVPTEIWLSQLRSGSAHWALALAVEVGQRPLTSGARCWGPAVPTEIWSLQLTQKGGGGRGRGRRRWAALLKKFRDLAGGELLVVYPIKSRLTGWWFRTFFSIYWDNNPNWLIFFRGVETSSQLKLIKSLHRSMRSPRLVPDLFLGVYPINPILWQNAPSLDWLLKNLLIWLIC